MNDHDYAEYMKVVGGHSSANFVLLRLDHLRFLGGDGSAAIVLSHLLNLLRLKDASPKDRRFLRKNNLWFRCPAKNLQTQLGMGEDRQRTAVKNLRSAGVIETERRDGNVLWVRVIAENLKKIEENPRNGGSRFPGTPETGNPRNRNGEPPEQKRGTPVSLVVTKNLKEESKNADCPPPQAGDDVCPSKGFFPDTTGTCRFDQECAELLYKKMGEEHKLVRHNSSASRWARDFRKLRLGLDDDRQRIKKVLDWYIEHFGESHVPEAFSAASFSEKFLKIEARMAPTAADRKKKEREEEQRRMEW